MEYQGRVVLVTGASMGLGREYALELARRGAEVVVCSRRPVEGPSKLDALVDEIGAAGGTALAVHADLGDPAAAERLVDAALSAFGRLDVVINNAGLVVADSFADARLADVDRQLDVHVRGAFELSRLAHPVMREQGYGRLVFTSSPAAVFGRPGIVGYAIAKMAVIGMATVVGIEGEPDGIKANSVLPMARSRLAGLVPPDPADRAFLELADPELVTPMVLYLAGESCGVNRRVFWASAGRYAEAFVGLTEGWTAALGTVPEPSEIGDRLAAITARHNYEEHPSLNAAMEAFMGRPPVGAVGPE